MIGSVRFEREPQEGDSAADLPSEASSLGSASRGQLHWGGSHSTSWLHGGELQPALEAVFGSQRARLMTSVQVCGGPRGLPMISAWTA